MGFSVIVQKDLKQETDTMWPDSEELLHSKASIRQASEYQTRAALEAVDSVPANKLTPESITQLVASLSDQFSMSVPTLNEAGIHPETRETDIDVSRDRSRYPFGGGPATVKGTEITISVPFTGDAEIFRFHASNHTINYPLARLEKNAIVFVKRGTNLEGPGVRREFDGWIATIKQHLQQMQAELGNFNDRVKSEIEASLQRRLAKIQRDTGLLTGLGFANSK